MQQPMVISQPLNDIQLVALMAAMIYAGPDGGASVEKAVGDAVELVAESILNGSPSKIDAAKKRRLMLAE